MLFANYIFARFLDALWQGNTPWQRQGFRVHHGNQAALCPNEAEREGYVPSVIYTCGALLHGHELIIPYAMSDSATSFAAVPPEELLATME